MKAIIVRRITRSAPFTLIFGMGCFIGAFFMAEPKIKNALLFGGLILVIASVIFYVIIWKYEQTR